MREEFLARLRRGAVLCDGAMGTELYAHGVMAETCFDRLNLTHPELVQDIHRAYLAAGVELIETNTFGANRLKLAERGIAADQGAAINTAGVQLARQAAERTGRRVFVAGAVGPLGARLGPIGPIGPAEAGRIFSEQITPLAAAGVDVLILETFGDLDEMLVAIQATQASCDLPIIAQMTFTQDERTPGGNSPGQVACRLAETGVAVVGVNCSVGPARVLAVIERMRAALGTGQDVPWLSAQPNAGWPHASGGRLLYPATPEYFADFAQRLVQAGVTIVGGCCGTTPAHSRAMHLGLNALALSPQPPPRLKVSAPKEDKATPVPEPPTELKRKLESGRFVVSVELSPPRGFDVGRVLSAALMLKQSGADMVNIADSPRAQARMSPLAVAHLTQTEVGLEAVLHFPVRGRNLLRVQGDLLAAHALRVRNVFVVMGDPPAIGDYPQATDTHDVVPSGLVRIIKHNLNQGVDGAGAPIGAPCSFTVGAALDMGAHDVARELKTLHKKIAAGVDFVLTQPVFDPAVARTFLRRYEDAYGALGLPVVLGVLPLASVRHAEFLNNEVPGIVIPSSVLDRMRQAGEQGRQTGVRVAREIIYALKDVVHGLYVMPPFERVDMAVQVFSEFVLPDHGSAGSLAQGMQ